MTVLKDVMDMQNRGVPEEQITSELTQQGISPREITDALNQAQIKNAIKGDEEMEEQDVPQMNEALYEPEEEDLYAPQTQDAYPEDDSYQESFAPPQQAYSSGGNSSLTIEIAEQVFMEKIRKTEKKLNEVIEFKTISQSKLENIENRLKRMENVIDKLQIDILREVGSYGKNLDTMKKEINMIEDSFGKVAKHKNSHKK